LSNVLRDIEDQDPAESLRDAQKDVLNQISRSCGELLDELRTTIDKYWLIDEKSVDTKKIRTIGRKVWKRLNWDQKDIDGYRQRLSTNIGSFNLFLTQVNK
jgi:hypothetical protein